VTGLPGKIVTIHHALQAADVPHAFGGALALAWCTQRARGTIDIDLNVFVSVDRVESVLSILPAGVEWAVSDVTTITRDGQGRLWWEGTPVDLFFNTTPFHERAAAHAQWEDFGGVALPFLDCSDLAVFKVFFDRTKDWADLEEMFSAGTIDVDRVAGALTRYLDPTDPRMARLRALAGDAADGA
jgi:hypothetical protein